MATLTLNIKTTNADALAYQNSDRNKSLGRAERLLRGLASGSVVGGCDVQVSASNPVAASGTATITFASIAANDTLVIGGVTLTCKASGAAAGVEFNKQTDATVTAANLAAAINANTVLSKHVVATSALGVVTVKARLKGSLGNLITLAATGTGIALVAMAGGTGGPEGVSVAFGG